jgi:hypothetical protein
MISVEMRAHYEGVKLLELTITLQVTKVGNKQTNSMALFGGRTIPTKRPPLFGEDSANFCG